MIGPFDHTTFNRSKTNVFERSTARLPVPRRMNPVGSGPLRTSVVPTSMTACTSLLKCSTCEPRTVDREAILAVSRCLWIKIQVQIDTFLKVAVAGKSPSSIRPARCTDRGVHKFACSRMGKCGTGVGSQPTRS